MKTEQKLWTGKGGWTSKSTALDLPPQIVFVFGGREQIQRSDHFEELRRMYPDAHLLLCSTAGEILGTHVYDDSLCVTAVHFEKTELRFAEISIEHASQSEAKGAEVAKLLPQERLAHVMVFSDGLMVNGTALVDGLTSALPAHVSVTGGLVGDGAYFKHTVAGLDKVPAERNIILIGFYGEALKVGYGSLGGWDTFGPDRMITRSEGNVLYELDSMPALDVYKEYLGDLAADLPGSGLLFPMRLEFSTHTGPVEVVRTLLAIDEEKKSLTFAGDMPQGATAVLMKANFDRLIDGAYGAAKMSEETSADAPELALLISCVGRKLVLKSRVEEETEAVQSVLGDDTVLTGFYSYGEICPLAATDTQCRLHNQTMTITTFKES